MDSESSDVGAWMPRQRGRPKSFMTRALDHMDVKRASEPSANAFGYFWRNKSTSLRRDRRYTRREAAQILC
jgi:hypothetical protein